MRLAYEHMRRCSVPHSRQLGIDDRPKCLSQFLQKFLVVLGEVCHATVLFFISCSILGPRQQRMLATHAVRFAVASLRSQGRTLMFQSPPCEPRIWPEAVLRG